MNDLGWALAWLAVQVALILGPGLVLHALASRRGPASGAWVATLGLGLVVVLGLSAFVPGINLRDERPTTPPPATASVLASAARAGASPVGKGQVARPEVSASTNSRGPTFEDLRRAWTQWGLRAAGPTARIRPWGRALAVVALAGSGVGLVRLLLGLWAVGLCRRRGRRVEDRPMVALVEELRGAMGYRPEVDVLEVPDLTTPATAGWLRPLLLLPDDWRSWDDSERRAVVAHELAHMIRGDYAAGLVARVAVVLHSYHPLVRWLAARLHLQQELAADSLGARFAGGRSSYLVALSRLALKQDGRSQSWAARAFLPARGTLIRRITMLRIETESTTPASSSSTARRLATALGLLALTIGVATVKAPLSAAEEGPSAPPVAKADVVEPFETSYLAEGTHGVVAFRPAAIARRLGIGAMNDLIREGLGGDLPTLAKQLGVDTSRPGFVKIGAEDIESIACGFTFGRPRGRQKSPDGAEMHTLEFSGVTVRTTAPFDWPTFFRGWTIDLDVVREPRGFYYKAKDPSKALVLMGCVFYQPDDRTLVIESEARVKQLIAREDAARPANLRGSDWERAGRGLLAVAINNKDGALAKSYDLGRADDAIVLTLLKGVDRWVFGIDDADSIAFHAEATCASPDASRSIAGTLDPLLKLCRGEVEAPVTEAMTTAVPSLEQMLRIGKGFFSKLRVEPRDDALNLSADGFATFAEVASIVESVMKPKDQQEAAPPKATKR